MRNKMLVMSLLLLSGLLSGVFAGGQAEATDEQTWEIQVGLVQNENDPLMLGLRQFKERVEARTNGRVQVSLFPSSQLGDTRDLQEQALAGANIAVLTDAARLAEMVPELGVMGAPYVVDSYDEALAMSQTPSFKSWEDELAQNFNLRVLSFNWYQGARHLLTNEPISGPDDLEGMIVRAPGSPVWQETVRAMGAEPTALAWAEIYPAVQQGVIDGAESHHSGTWGASFYEVLSHITKTRHFQLNTCLVVGNDWFESLPAEFQQILFEEALAGGTAASERVISDLEQFEQQLIDAGMTVSDIDVTPFIERTQVVYELTGLVEARDAVYAEMGR